MLDYGCGVPYLPKLLFTEYLERGMYSIFCILLPHSPQLLYPSADVLATGIKLQALLRWVEYQIVPLPANARPGTPSPACVIAGKVTIDEVFHEEALAASPVDQQVFGQEGGHDYACNVGHVFGS